MDADVLNTQIINLLEEFEYREQDKARIDALYTLTRAIGSSLEVIKQRNLQLEQHAFPSAGSTGDLTPDEQQFVIEYRKMDDRARAQSLRCAKRSAEDWPRDFITVPADLEEAQQEANISPANPSLSRARDEVRGLLTGAPNLNDALDSIADEREWSWP